MANREAMLAKRAAALKTPILYANLVGGQDELVFDGGSMALDDAGIRCRQAAYFAEDEYTITLSTQPNTPLLFGDSSAHHTIQEAVNIRTR